jgi:hypothetical protein
VNKNYSFEQDFLFYEGYGFILPVRNEQQSSGAYVFRPANNTPQSIAGSSKIYIQVIRVWFIPIPQCRSWGRGSTDSLFIKKLIAPPPPQNRRAIDFSIEKPLTGFLLKIKNLKKFA